MSQKKKKAYIFGPMSGIKYLNKKEFDRAESLLKGHGYVVLNPANTPSGLEYSDYMDISMAQIRACDYMFGLSNWEASPGAKAEVAIGLCLGKAFCREHMWDIAPFNPTITGEN